MSRWFAFPDVEQAFQPQRVETNAGVGEGDPFRSGGGDTHVTAAAGRGRSGLDDAKPRVLNRQLSSPADRQIAGTPIHQNDFVRGSGLLTYREEKAFERPFLIAKGNDESDR